MSLTRCNNPYAGVKHNPGGRRGVGLPLPALCDRPARGGRGGGGDRAGGRDDVEIDLAAQFDLVVAAGGDADEGVPDVAVGLVDVMADLGAWEGAHPEDDLGELDGSDGQGESEELDHDPASGGEDGLGDDEGPPDVPPPPAAHAEPVPARPRAAPVGGGDWGRITLHKDGAPVGDLVWDRTTNTLNAHCSVHRKCHFDKKCNRNASRPGQGRPIGLLVAWLIDSPDCATKLQHKDHKEHLSFTSDGRRRRKNAREWMHTVPEYRALFTRERSPDTGEGSEPDVVP
jgi:hypothetical protein